MKPVSFKHFLVVLLSLTIITSCKKENFLEEDAGGYGNVSYFAKATGTGVEKREIKSDNTMNTVAVEWSAASIYVERIAFVGEGDNKIDTTIFVEKNIDIFKADALTEMIKLPTGSYKDVRVKLFARKSERSELAFDLRGTFINTKGGRDSVIVASSYPFEANLEVTDIIINPSDTYNVTFTFNLDKVLTGITTELLQTARSYAGANNNRLFVIWKGGSDEEPFYNQVIENWQTVSSVVVTKQ